MARIAIDADGVLADFSRGFYEEAHRLFPGVVPVDYQPNRWDDFGGLSANSVDIVWQHIRSTPNWWLGLRAHSDNLGALAKFFIRRMNQDVWIVTSRSETAGMTVAKQTAIWLKACGMDAGHNYLAVMPTPNAHKKERLYKAVEMEYSIDDKGTTVQECDRLDNHKAFLLDRPWNQEFSPKRRVKSLEEFLGAIP